MRVTQKQITLFIFFSIILFYRYGASKREHGEYITYTLMVRRLIPADAGFYSCMINVKGARSNENPTKFGQLVVVCKSDFL